MRRTAPLVGLLAIGVVAIWAVAAVALLPALMGGAGAATSPAAPGAAGAGAPTAGSASPARGPGSSPASSREPGPVSVPPAPGSKSSATPESTPAASTSTDETRSRFRAFVTRLETDRRRVAELNDALLTGARADDPGVVRSAAVDILQFADGERDWLLAHPPADCYAAAHAAAGSMLEAYATVADRAIDWVDAEPGLAALDALAAVFVAASSAQDAVPALTGALEASTCPR
jgi:hypothetical protein